VSNLNFKKLFSVAVFAFAFSVTAYAADEDKDATLEKIDSRTKVLEKEIKTLKKQVAAQKAADKTKVVSKPAETTPAPIPEGWNDSMQILKFGATPVVTSPYIGVRSEYSGGDLIVRVSAYDQDLQLLKQRRARDDRYEEAGRPFPDSPIVELSGKVEGGAASLRTFTGSHNSDIDLASAELDITAHANQWVTGFMIIKYENVQLSPIRVSNSRFILDKGFVTVGNLNVSPGYFTVGQREIPFGQYHSFTVSGPLTRAIGGTKQRAILVGYHPKSDKGFYASVYGFRGDSRPRADVNTYGGTIGHLIDKKSFTSDFGVDVISNIADSDVMQSTGAMLPFTGFGASFATEMLDKRVPGIDIHEALHISPMINIYAEYTGATESFSSSDMTYNGSPARPRAYALEGVVMFPTMNKPSSFEISASGTKEALALNLPRQRYIAAYNFVPWKNTITTVEYRRENHYSPSNTATGAGSGVFGRPGDFSNQILWSLGVYF